jgi:hypothetical protein
METQSPPRNTPTASIVSALCLSFLLLSTTAPSLAAAASAKGKLHMAIVDEATGAPIPARVHLKDASGAEIKTAAYPYHKGHFTCPGFFELSLPAGEYRYEAEHGQIAATIPFENWKKNSSLGKISFNESGWFLVRAITDNPVTFRFASTAPFYVEFSEERRRVSKASAQFFLDWVRERMERVKLENPEQKEAVLKHHRDAAAFWNRKVTEANAE